MEIRKIDSSFKFNNIDRNSLNNSFTSYRFTKKQTLGPSELDIININNFTRIDNADNIPVKYKLKKKLKTL